MTRNASVSAASAPAPSDALSALAGLPPRIVFFDGVCAFCDGAVRWLRAHDPAGHMHFAPLQGETAEIVRRAFPGRFPTDIDTLVYLRPSQGSLPAVGGREIVLRSAAIFALCDEIGGAWRLVAWLRFLPRALTDFGYRIFAKNRYRWFGTIEACDLPTPEERLRQLR